MIFTICIPTKCEGKNCDAKQCGTPPQPERIADLNRFSGKVIPLYRRESYYESKTTCKK